MVVEVIKTRKILAGSNTILEILDQYLPAVGENTVVAVTSKVVALCENRIVAMDKITLEELIRRESSFYSSPSKVYGQIFTITDNTLVGKSGIDKNSKRGYYILWPKDSQQTSNQIREFVAKKFDLKNVGVVITDSISTPMRFGVTGIAIAHSGFEALKHYKYSQANISGGLAAAAVVVMGEGIEHTPIAVIKDLPFVKFQDRNPVPDELEGLKLTIETDFFEPFLTKTDWRKGQSKNT